MNSLGFKNFRKFTELKPLEFKGITFLVGRNNAGKSTFVRALILLLEYFKSDRYHLFPLSSKLSEDFSITSFGRAKNRNSKDDDVIQFNLTLGNFNVEIYMSGADDDKEAYVFSLVIKNVVNCYEFKFEPEDEQVYFNYSSDERDKNSTDALDNALASFKSERKKIRTELKEINSQSNPKEHAEKKNELNKLNKNIKAITTVRTMRVSISDSYNISSYMENGNKLDRTVKDFIESNTNYYYEELQNSKDQEDEITISNFKNFATFSEDIWKSFDGFFNMLNNLDYRYLSSYSAKQSGLLFIKDKYNALSQAVNDFYIKKIYPGAEPYEFIKLWMKEFEIGTDFKIVSHLGEAYEVNIIDDSKSLNLADKGMGSIQIMLLLFRLASILKKAKDSTIRPILFIEEPELNLHPALQSKLADLFLEVNKKYGIQFVIETHSEYLIRNTQLLVKEGEFEIAPNENPFTVIYFDEEKGPYKMNYREDGKFIENFGKGFYDESALLTLNLL